MKAEKAIKKVKDKYEGWMGYARSQKEVDELEEERDKVIVLLQQGEKCRLILQLVEEEKIQVEINDCGKMFFMLEANDKSNKIMFGLRAPFRHLLCHTLEELKQEYFPK